MKQVLQKTQELAEAIMESEYYRKMKQKESETRRDEEAASLLDDMIIKRQRVEDILSSADMDPEELKRASAEMNAARKDFQTMMDNVNQLLRLAITGESGEGGRFRRSSGCGGSCEGCNGCG